jgi:hypothetical protein
VLVDNGRAIPGDQSRGMARVGQAIEILSGSSRRRITDADRLAVHPLMRVVPGSDLTSISQVIPSADGRYVAVWLSRINATGTYTGQVFVVVDVESGEPVGVTLPFEPRVGIGDLAWSPSGDRFGWTRSTFGTNGYDTTRTAVVRDVAGRTILERDGRFAGWSPEGDWIYVARNEGLFAARLDGSAEVRVSALGVAPVVATRP